MDNLVVIDPPFHPWLVVLDDEVEIIENYQLCVHGLLDLEGHMILDGCFVLEE